MYIRFVIGAVDPDSGVESGILQTVLELLEYDDLPAHTREGLHELGTGFAATSKRRANSTGPAGHTASRRQYAGSSQRRSNISQRHERLSVPCRTSESMFVCSRQTIRVTSFTRTTIKSLQNPSPIRSRNLPPRMPAAVAYRAGRATNASVSPTDSRPAPSYGRDRECCDSRLSGHGRVLWRSATHRSPAKDREH